MKATSRSRWSASPTRRQSDEWTLELQYRLISESSAGRCAGGARPLHQGSARYGHARRHGRAAGQASARVAAAAPVHPPAPRSHGPREDRPAAAQRPSASRHHRRAQDRDDRRGHERRGPHHAARRRGHLAMAVFTTNGARPAATQDAIAEMAAAAYEAFTGKPLPPREKPKGRAVKSARRNAAKKRVESRRPAASDGPGVTGPLPRSARTVD